MGQHAEDLLNGDVDPHTGEWLGGGRGYPRPYHNNSIDHNKKLYKKGTKAIRKELAIMINERKAKIENITSKQENIIVDECRQAINKKYGKGWREQF